MGASLKPEIRAALHLSHLNALTIGTASHNNVTLNTSYWSTKDCMKLTDSLDPSPDEQQSVPWGSHGIFLIGTQESLLLDWLLLIGEPSEIQLMTFLLLLLLLMNYSTENAKASKNLLPSMWCLCVWVENTRVCISACMLIFTTAEGDSRRGTFQ